MSDQQQSDGPMMIAATKILRPPPARIGHIGDISLPRTIPIRAGIAAAVGAFIGTIFGLPFGGAGLLYAAIAGGALGVLAVTWSPIEGESLLKWMGLELLASRRTRVWHNGHKVRISIGICPLPRVAGGNTIIQAGSIEVAPGSVDQRGALITASNRNVPDTGRPRRNIADHTTGVPLPTRAEEGKLSRRRRRRQGNTATTPANGEQPTGPTPARRIARPDQPAEEQAEIVADVQATPDREHQQALQQTQAQAQPNQPHEPDSRQDGSSLQPGNLNISANTSSPERPPADEPDGRPSMLGRFKQQAAQTLSQLTESSRDTGGRSIHDAQDSNPDDNGEGDADAPKVIRPPGS